MNRKTKNLLICLRILKINADKHLKVWGDELKYRDGYLAPWIKGWITCLHNKTTEMENKYFTVEADNLIKDSDIDKTLREIYDFCFLQKSRKQKAGDVLGFYFEEERKTFPDPMMLDSYVSFSLTVEFINNYHQITMERLGIKETYEKFLIQANKYIKWFENNLIVTGEIMV